MKKNRTPTLPANWAPADRMLWLAKHDAPPNMRLCTDLELHLIDRGLNAERIKALDYEKKCSALEMKLHRATSDLDSYITALQAIANQMDEPVGLEIINDTANRIRATINALKA